jgi:hypothetical protein
MAQQKKNKSTQAILIIAVVILGAITLLSFFASGIFGGDTNKEVNPKIATIVLDYLNKKYGDHDFKVLKTYKRDLYKAYNDIDQIGFTAQVTSPEISDRLLRDTFTVDTNGTDEATTEPVQDEFIEAYYSDTKDNQATSNFGNTGYTVRPGYYFNYDKPALPNNLGHIPTIGELADYGILYRIDIRLEGDDGQKLNGQESIDKYVRNAAVTLADYYEIKSGVEIHISYYENDSRVGGGDFKINESNIHRLDTETIGGKTYPRVVEP